MLYQLTVFLTLEMMAANCISYLRNDGSDDDDDFQEPLLGFAAINN